MKLKYYLILVLSMVLGIGCQNLADEMVGKKPEDARLIDITLIGKSAANPVFLTAKRGAESAAAEISDKYKMLDVRITWRTPKTENAAEQAEKIRNAVENGTDAIIVSCSDDTTLTKAINMAVDNDVAVMTFDSDAPNSKRFAFYGPDDIKLGGNIMDELATQIGGQGEIAILGGNKEAPNLQTRVKGVKQAAANHPNIKIVGDFYHVENADAAIAEVLRVNQAYPNLKGWAMVGGWPFFDEKLISKLGGMDIKIVSVDALPVQLPFIDQGIVAAFLGQPTFQWGEICVEKIVDKLHHKKEVDEFNEMKLIRVNPDNLGGWSRQLRAWGYKGIPDKYLVL